MARLFFVFLLGQVIFQHAPLAQAQDIGSAISSKIAEQIGSSIAGSTASRLLKLSLTVDKTKGRFKEFTYQPNNILLQHFDNDSLIVWDFLRGSQIAEFTLPGFSSPLRYDIKTGALVIVHDGQIKQISKSGTNSHAPKAFFRGSTATTAAASTSSHLFVGFKDGSFAKLTTDGKTLWQIKVSDRPLTQLVSDKNGTRISALAENGRCVLLNEAGNVIASFNNIQYAGPINQKGEQSFLTIDQQLLRFTASELKPQISSPDSSVSISTNETMSEVLALTKDGNLYLLKNTRWEMIDSKVTQVGFVNQNRFLVARSDGVLHLKEKDLSHYLLAVIPAETGWIVVDHEGRYDGTQAGTKDVRWSAENVSMDINQFFSAYFQPGLLAAYIEGDESKSLQKIPASPENGVLPPAKVEMQFPDGKLKSGEITKIVAIAESEGGSIPGDIRIFHNGKRLPDKARLASQRAQQGNKHVLVQVFGFTPIPGINEVFADAQNAHGISNRSDVKRETTDDHVSKGRLFLLGIGLNKYEISSFNLNYATVDVTTAVKKFEQNGVSIFSDVKTRFVLDNKATRAEIHSSLKQLENLSADDTVIIYFAGHGVVEKGEWYFLSHDFSISKPLKSSVSAKELQEFLVNSPSQRMFILLDTCNAGAGIDTFNRYRAFQRRFVQQLGRNAGVTILTGTRRDQLAAELPQLGHGVFTHVILQGLNEKSISDAQGRISAHELAKYVETHLESVSKPFLADHGLAQSPAIFAIGADFLIATPSNKTTNQ